MTGPPGFVVGHIRHWLRVEGALALVLATVLFNRAGYSWTLFAVLFLMPDVSFAGYIAGPRVGAVVYNALHSYAAPLLLAVLLVISGQSVAVPLIWVAHIGLDRMLGYGLKYPEAFTNTHLGRIGRRAPAP